jgi:hypothetical protein
MELLREAMVEGCGSAGRRMRMLKLPKLVRLEDGDDDLRMMVQHRGKL